MSLVRAINPAFPALLPKPVPGLFCGRVIPGSSEVPSESSVIASHSLPAPLCSPSRVSSVGSVIESRSLSASPCLHVVPEFSEGPSVNSDPHRLPETWTALLVCGFRILERSFQGHVIPTHSVSCLPPCSVPAGSLSAHVWFSDPRMVLSRTRHTNTLCVLSPASLCASCSLVGLLLGSACRFTARPRLPS